MITVNLHYIQYDILHFISFKTKIAYILNKGIYILIIVVLFYLSLLSP